jgi:AbrB family looped-hinge helix DNA binding protein
LQCGQVTVNVPYELSFSDGIYHDKMPFMAIKTTIDRAGRVVLPKPLRDDLQLAQGDWLSLESNGNEIIIRPLRGIVPLEKKSGIWTFGSGEPLSLEQVNQTVQQIRRERDLKNLGPDATRGRRTGKKAKSL